MYFRRSIPKSSRKNRPIDLLISGTDAPATAGITAVPSRLDCCFTPETLASGITPDPMSPHMPLLGLTYFLWPTVRTAQEGLLAPFWANLGSLFVVAGRQNASRTVLERPTREDRPMGDARRLFSQALLGGLGQKTAPGQVMGGGVAVDARHQRRRQRHVQADAARIDPLQVDIDQ